MGFWRRETWVGTSNEAALFSLPAVSRPWPWQRWGRASGVRAVGTPSPRSPVEDGSPHRGVEHAVREAYRRGDDEGVVRAWRKGADPRAGQPLALPRDRAGRVKDGKGCAVRTWAEQALVDGRCALAAHAWAHEAGWFPQGVGDRARYELAPLLLGAWQRKKVRSPGSGVFGVSEEQGLVALTYEAFDRVSSAPFPEASGLLAALVAREDSAVLPLLKEILALGKEWVWDAWDPSPALNALILGPPSEEALAKAGVVLDVLPPAAWSGFMDPAAQETLGRALLPQALHCGRWEAAEWLLDQGCSLNQRGIHEATPTMLGVLAPDPLWGKLLKSDFGWSAVDAFGRTVLHHLAAAVRKQESDARSVGRRLQEDDPLLVRLFARWSYVEEADPGLADRRSRDTGKRAAEMLSGFARRAWEAQRAQQGEQLLGGALPAAPVPRLSRRF